MVRAVCFDLMGTLLYDPYLEALFAATGLELHELAGIRDPGCWAEFELGRIDEPEFARRFFTVPDRTFDLDAFNRTRRERYAYLPGIPELLDDLAGRVDLHVASNYPVWIDEVARTFGFHTKFAGVWSSHHLGARKPERAFFDLLLEKVGHPAPACLFVDDRAENCDAAAGAGFRVHEFSGAAGLAARLREEGLLR